MNENRKKAFELLAMAGTFGADGNERAAANLILQAGELFGGGSDVGIYLVNASTKLRLRACRACGVHLPSEKEQVELLGVGYLIHLEKCPLDIRMQVTGDELITDDSQKLPTEAFNIGSEGSAG